MKISEERTNIIKAMINVQKDMKPIKKDRENKFADNFKYATLDAILESVLPVLAKNDIFMTQEPETEILDGAIGISVTTKFYHSSGEFIEYAPLMFQLEKGAKMNLAQSSGSVITYIKRYSLTAALGISSDEDVDGATPTEQKKAVEEQQRAEQQQLEEIKKNINGYKKYLEENGADLEKVEAYILKQLNVPKLSMANPVQVIGYYKSAAMRQKSMNKSKKQVEPKIPVWGQK